MLLMFNLILFCILFVAFLIVVYRVARMAQLREQQFRNNVEIELIKERLATVTQRIEDRRAVLQSVIVELEKRRREKNNTTTSS